MISDELKIDQSSSQYPTGSIRAHAKLNISLSVLGRRADGYHLLEMLNVPVPIFDELSISLITPSNSSKVMIHENGVDLSAQQRGELLDPTKNLAARGIQAILDRLEKRSSFELKIRKGIPLGSGLGGGSSDAAAAMKLTLALLKNTLPQSELTSLGLKLGADVPYFLTGGSAWVRGVGEIVQPLNLPVLTQLQALVFLPPFGCSTQKVYEQLRILKPNLPQHPTKPVTTTFIQDWSDFHAQNDLEAAAVTVEPRLGEFLDVLRRTASGAAKVGMTGSGSACFVLLPVGKNDLIASLCKVIEQFDARVVQCPLG